MDREYFARQCRKSILLFVGLLPVVFGSCSSSGNADQDNRIVLTGSSTVAPLVGEIAKRFEILHPGVRVDVQSGGSSRGVVRAHFRLINECRGGDRHAYASASVLITMLLVINATATWTGNRWLRKRIVTV